MASASVLYPEFIVVMLTFSAVMTYQIELTRAEVESLRSEIADADEWVSQLKARYDEVPLQYSASTFVWIFT